MNEQKATTSHIRKSDRRLTSRESINTISVFSRHTLLTILRLIHSADLDLANRTPETELDARYSLP